MQVDAKNYDRLIAQSNYTSILEFYAPWCGHCKNLQPAYEKAAKSLSGLAKVAAIDCDDDANKAFCGGMGVQGFPTLKIVKPGSKPGKPIVEDYQGPRTAKGIVDAVIDKIPNLVKRVDDKTLEKFLAEANDTAKAILFSDKGKTSALLKAVAIEFKGSIQVAQIRNTEKEKASLELFGIEKFPTLILLPGGKEAEGIVYDGEMNKEGMVKFLSQAATPNPDPAPAKVKVQKPKDGKKASKKKEEFESASSEQAKEEGSTAGASATDETLEEDATESPEPTVEAEKPIVLPDPALPLIHLAEAGLLDRCMGPKTGTCVLALLPDSPNEVANKAVDALTEVAHHNHIHKRALFPFFVLPEATPGYTTLKEKLGLKDFDVIAINAKRGWWRGLPNVGEAIQEGDVSQEALENWVESIRLGEGVKQKLPDGLVPEEPVEEPVPEEPAAAEEPIVVEEVKVEDDVKDEVHDEL